MNPIITPSQIRTIVLYTVKALIERQMPQSDEQAISDNVKNILKHQGVDIE